MTFYPPILDGSHEEQTTENQIVVVDENFVPEENLGLMLNRDGALEPERCGLVYGRQSSAPRWISEAASGVARVWITRTDADSVHQGTAFHVGQGYYLTAAHTLRFVSLDLTDPENRKAIPLFNGLSMQLVRPRTGHDPACVPGRSGTVTMGFTIVCYTRTIEADQQNFDPFFTSIRDNFESKGFAGRLPLPLNYVVPRNSDLALIRVVKADRSKVRSAFFRPGTIRAIRPDTEVACIAINGVLSQVDWNCFYHDLAEALIYVNTEVLRAKHVSFVTALGRDLIINPTGKQGVAKLRFHNSKGSSGSPFVKLDKSGIAQLFGILTSSDIHDTDGDKLRNEEMGVFCRTWDIPEFRELIRQELIPRLRRSKNLFERLRYRKTNTLSEEWFQATRLPDEVKQ